MENIILISSLFLVIGYILWMFLSDTPVKQSFHPLFTPIGIVCKASSRFDFVFDSSLILTNSDISKEINHKFYIKDKGAILYVLNIIIDEKKEKGTVMLSSVVENEAPISAPLEEGTKEALLSSIDNVFFQIGINLIDAK